MMPMSQLNRWSIIPKRPSIVPKRLSSIASRLLLVIQPSITPPIADDKGCDGGHTASRRYDRPILQA